MVLRMKSAPSILTRRPPEESVQSGLVTALALPLLSLKFDVVFLGHAFFLQTPLTRSIVGSSKPEVRKGLTKNLLQRYERKLLKGESDLPLPITSVEFDDREAQGLRDSIPGGTNFSGLPAFCFDSGAEAGGGKFWLENVCSELVFLRRKSL